VRFEWDEAKAITNLEKHGVSFFEASEVFEDEFMQYAYDEDHSDDEPRFLAMGETKRQRLLLVSHTVRDESIQIISARDMTANERRTFEEGE
jgi:uncharacterized protein